jgi:hypothetical protein
MTHQPLDSLRLQAFRPPDSTLMIQLVISDHLPGFRVSCMLDLPAEVWAAYS